LFVRSGVNGTGQEARVSGFRLALRGHSRTDSHRSRSCPLLDFTNVFPYRSHSKTTVSTKSADRGYRWLSLRRAKVHKRRTSFGEQKRFETRARTSGRIQMTRGVSWVRIDLYDLDLGIDIERYNLLHFEISLVLNSRIVISKNH
jgi:hypothetical protein